MVWNVYLLHMISCSSRPVIERAQPWLGTLVSIRVADVAEAEAHHAIDCAFQEIANVHRLMSFHDSGSDLSRLNRARAGEPVEVYPYTYQVLQQALDISAISHGYFDVTIGAELVAWELLPCPNPAHTMHSGSWRDIELLPDNKVIFHKSLCVDLGGIAKGYAVDLAVKSLQAQGVGQIVVNAGGDIRVQGLGSELIRLAAKPFQGGMAALELTNASIASSSGEHQRRKHRGLVCGPHVDAVQRRPAPTDRFVSVVADQCILADALTKVVMVMGTESKDILEHFGASAYFRDPLKKWHSLEAEGTVAG